MRSITYLACFTLVALSTFHAVVNDVLRLFDIAPIDNISLSWMGLLGSLVPRPFASSIPSTILLVLQYLMVCVLLRRTWLCAAKNERVPSAFRGVQESLGYVGIFSLLLSSLILLLSSLVVLNEKFSGNDATIMLLAALYALIGIPAWFCIPWSLFITEVLSFRYSLSNDAKPR